MIITRIIPCAGMGNQMFMYAAGLAAAKRLNTELRLGIWNFSVLTREGRPYQLNCFPEITEAEASFRETANINLGIALINLLNRKPIHKYHFFRRVLRKILYKVSRIKGSFYEPSYCSWSPDFLNIKDNTFISGYWESEKIFEEIKDLVRKKFTFSPECFSTELSALVKNCDSVAVHVRRSDKVILSNASESKEDYLKKAIAKIYTLTDNPKFFVFSDDIDWCKDNMNKIYDTEYTFIEGQTPPQDMTLMTQCKHVIVGPSTFSWWGAWLNNNPDKIIIAPDINLWYQDVRTSQTLYEDRKYLLPESWIKIS